MSRIRVVRSDFEHGLAQRFGRHLSLELFDERLHQIGRRLIPYAPETHHDAAHAGQLKAARQPNDARIVHLPQSRLACAQDRQPCRQIRMLHFAHRPPAVGGVNAGKRKKAAGQRIIGTRYAVRGEIKQVGSGRSRHDGVFGRGIANYRSGAEQFGHGAGLLLRAGQRRKRPVGRRREMRIADDEGTFEV